MLTRHKGFSFPRGPESIFAVGFALRDLGLHSSQLPEKGHLFLIASPIQAFLTR